MLLMGLGVLGAIVCVNVAVVALGLLLLWRRSRVEASGEACVQPKEGL